MDTQTRTMAQQNNSPSEQIHLSDYLNILKKRKWLIILFSILLIGIVTTFSFLSMPVYQATAQIIIERRMYPVTGAEEVVNNDIKEKSFYQTQYNLLQSRGLALMVIKDLQLWKATGNPQLLPDKLSAEEVNNQDSFSPSDWSKMIDWYLGNLAIAPIRDSRLINISFISNSPDTSARVANAHASAFIERSAGLKHSAFQEGLNWLKTQLQEQKLNVEKSQRAVHEYKKEHDVVSFEDRRNVVSQKFMDLNATLTRLKSERMAKQALYNQLREFSIKDEDIFFLPEVAQNSVIRNLRSQLILLKDQRLEMAANFGPRHPKMINLNLRTKQLEEEITSEVQILSKSIKADLDRAVSYERSIQQSLNAQKGEALSVNEKAINYDVLLQESESNQQLYDSLLKQYKELGLAGALENSTISLVDEAEAPLSPVKPRIFLNILLSIVLSMFMGPFLAFFFEYMDNTVKTREDIQRRLGLTVLGAVPVYNSSKNTEGRALFWDESYSKKKKKKNYYGDMSSRFIPALHIMQNGSDGKVIFMESATSGEGKTTVLANSALSLARKGLKVLMVDADIELSELHNVFGVKNEGGLVTVMHEIISEDITQGSLEKISMDDLLFIAEVKKLSGNLTITSNSQTMSVVIQNGRLLHLQSQNSPLANRLGTMLVRGGFISESQLEDAMESNKRTGRPLGHILLNSGYITREQLRGPLKLQMEEHLQQLFSWKHGTFVFEPMNIKTYEDEKIYFSEDYRPMIHSLGSAVGSRLLEDAILSRIVSINELDVSLLPSGNSSDKINGLTYQELFSKFLDILKRHFDVILVDVPPLLDVPGAALLSSLGDGVIFVIRAGNLSDKALREAITRLDEAKASIIGAVLNRSKSLQEY